MYLVHLPPRRTGQLLVGFAMAAAGVGAGEPMLSAERTPTQSASPWEVSPTATAPEFRGVMTLGPVLSVALAAAPDLPPRWVPLGGRWGDYVVTAFEAGRDVLVLTSPAGEIRLPLKMSRAGPGRGESSASPEVIARVRENLLQLAVAAAYYFRTTAAGEVTFADLVGPGRMIEALRPVAGEDYAGLRLARSSGPLSLALEDGPAVEASPEAVALASARYHVTRADDDLAGIARRAGQPVAAVLELNELAAPDELPRAGRLLRLR